MLSHIRIAMHFGNIIQLRFYSQYFRGFSSLIFHKLSLTCQSFPESTMQTEYADILGAGLRDHEQPRPRPHPPPLLHLPRRRGASRGVKPARNPKGMGGGGGGGLSHATQRLVKSSHSNGIA